METLELFPEEPLKQPGEVHPFNIYDRFECPGCLLEYPDEAKDPDCILCDGNGETTYADIIDKVTLLTGNAAIVSAIKDRLKRGDEYMERYARFIDEVCDDLEVICRDVEGTEWREMVMSKARHLRSLKKLADVNEIFNKRFIGEKVQQQ